MTTSALRRGAHPACEHSGKRAILAAFEQEGASMTDNRQDRGKPDRSRISLEEAHEVRYWTRELGVSEADLRRAMDMVGSNSAVRVREFLKTLG
jgi:hypothetical protein